MESLIVPSTDSREKIYSALLPQIEGLISGEDDLVANLANITAVLKESFHFLWVGFYWVKKDELVLGPFQGPIACTRIAFDRGVCGHAYSTKKTTIVPNVDEFSGHIACSSNSKSEIVVPVIDKKGHVLGVLDVDSDKLNDFTEVDLQGLESIVKILLKNIDNDLKRKS